MTLSVTLIHEAVVLDDQKTRRQIVFEPKRIVLRRLHLSKKWAQRPRLRIRGSGDGTNMIAKVEVVNLSVFPSAKPRFANPSPQIPIIRDVGKQHNGNQNHTQNS